MTAPSFVKANLPKVEAGKNILLYIADVPDTGEPTYLAVAGQQGLTINRAADTFEVNDKTSGDWKQNLAGLKEWSVDIDGAYAVDEASFNKLNTIFSAGDYVVVKVVKKVGETVEDLFGGFAIIADFPLEAPYDDGMTYSLSLTGTGELHDISADAVDQV